MATQEETVTKVFTPPIGVPVIALIAAAILAAGWLLQPVWAWATMIVLLALFTVLVGRRLVRLWRGAFIDDRNKVSLSRFQAILWTLLIVAGYLSAGLHNIRTGQSDPLGIALPTQLWALLGISATALAGSALIKSQQTTTKRANPGEVGQKRGDTVDPVPGTNYLSSDGKPIANGVLAVNATPEQSNWVDMFRSEQAGDENKLDLGKIQMFYFTIVIVLAYGVAIAALLRNASGKISEFPALDNSIVALLGISSAAYLTNKSIIQSDTRQPESQADRETSKSSVTTTPDDRRSQ